MDKRIQDIFFTLLRSALSGDECNLIAYAPVTDKEWQEVYSVAEEQGLTGVTFSAIERLPKNQLPDMDTLMDWLGQTEYIKTQNEEYRKNSEEFLSKVLSVASFGESQQARARGEGLEVRVLKGLECAKYYPQPERRALGDLDIVCLNANPNANVNCIAEGYRLCNEICEKNGWKVDFHDYKHSKIKFGSLDIENHVHLTECRGFKERQEAEEYLKGLLVNADHDQDVNYPPAQFNALFLTMHGFIHFMEEGITMRHVTDWAMFVRKNQGVVNWNEVREWTDRLGMTRFMDGMNWMTENLLGVLLPAELSGKGKEVGELLLVDILNGKRKPIDSGLSNGRFQWEKTKNMFRNTWKFKKVYGRNVLWYYLKFCWGYVFDRNPRG